MWRVDAMSSRNKAADLYSLANDPLKIPPTASPFDCLQAKPSLFWRDQLETSSLSCLGALAQGMKHNSLHGWEVLNGWSMCKQDLLL